MRSAVHPTSRRRLATAAAVLAASSLVLSACGQADNAEESDGNGNEEVNLRFTWWGADARAQLTEEVVDMFEEQNPGITVTPEASTWDGYWDKLATTAAAGDMPDVLQMDESQIASYGEQGTLLDLESQPESLDVSSIEPEVLLTGDVDGTIVGAPVGIALFSVGVNPEILDRAGLEMPDDTTWTWDDFVSMAAQVSDELGDEGVTGMDFYALQSSELGSFVRQHGQEVFPREGEEPVTAETLEAFFELALELVETGAAPSPAAQTEAVTAPLEQQPFGTNTTAFHLLFHTQIQAFVDASGAELQLLRLPAPSGGEPNMVNKASMYWSIASGTEHPEEAAKLVDFLLNDEEAAKVLGVERGVPGIPEIQEAIRPVLGETGTMSLDFAADLQDEVIEPPQVTPSYAGDFGNEVTRIGGSVLFGESTPEEGAQALLDVIEGYQE